MTAFFKNLSTNQIILLGIVVSAIAVTLVFSGAIPAPEVPRVQASASDNMSGWAYSSNFEWISFNRTDCDANDDGLSDGVPLGCPSAGTPIPNYGVKLDTGTKLLSGYAWGNNIGWIQFGGLAGFPTGDGTQAVNAQLVVVDGSNKLVGWARALSATGAQAGGWDGWLSLSGTGYGVTLNGSAFQGYSWDGSNTVITVPPAADQFDGVGIGWIRWDPKCDDGSPCGGVVISGNAPTVDLQIGPSGGPYSNSPFSGTEPASYDVVWTTTNSPTSCTASGGDPTWTASLSKDPAGGSQLFSNISAGAYTYTLTCENFFGSSADSVTANVAFAAAELNLIASPSTVDPGDPTTLTWTSTNVKNNTCGLTSDPSIAPLPLFGQLNENAVGVTVNNLQRSTLFTITCEKVAGGDIDDTARVTVEEIFRF